MKTTLISFYSDVDDSTYYSNHSERLISNCKELNIPFDIREKESLGDYKLNCLSKPQFVLDMLNEKDEPIIWMDIDTIIHKPLDSLDAFHDSDYDVVFSSSNGQISGAKASPVCCNNTQGARTFLEEWIHNTHLVLEHNVNSFDHEVLFPLLKKYNYQNSPIKIAYLPPTYCVWPGDTNNDSIITMGLADGESKKDGLRKMGMNESLIEWQSTGNKFLNDEGKIKL